jgi:hypothetical protein
MEQQKKPLSPEQMAYVWIAVGIALAIAFIVIGSVFFGLKPGPTNTNTAGTNTEEVNPSLYAPSDY